jgi:hypothetical protein
MSELRIAEEWRVEHDFHPGLDWSPIQRGIIPPSSWLVAMVRWAILGIVLLLGTLAWEMEIRAEATLESPESKPSALSVPVLLRIHPPPMVARTAPGPSPSGIGHAKGTDSIDPALLREALTQPRAGLPLDSGPDAILPGGDGLRNLTDLDLSLPQAPGGTGWAKGTGRDATRGGSRGPASSGSPRPDLKLVLLHEEQAVSHLPFSDPRLRFPVVVLLTIGPEGIPTGARPLSGPKPLYPETLAAAMKWRFEPLAPHGLSAPYSLRLTFHPQLRSGMRGGKPLTGESPPTLVPLHSEPLIVPVAREHSSMQAPIVVLVEVGSDGVPISAKPLSGAEGLFPEAMKAALKFRFKPFAPKDLTLTLRLSLQPVSRWQKNSDPPVITPE